MASTVVCTGKVFRGLTDRYTGEPLETIMLMSPSGEVRFAAPEAYSTKTRHPTAEAAYAAWARRGGVDGVRKGEPIRCAYTGELLTPATDGQSHWFEGGVDLRRFRSRDEYLYYASMTDGKSEFPEPGGDMHVGTVKEKPDRQVLGHGLEITDESMKSAEDVMKKTGFAPQRRTVVSMANARRKRG